MNTPKQNFINRAMARGGTPEIAKEAEERWERENKEDNEKMMRRDAIRRCDGYTDGEYALQEKLMLGALKDIEIEKALYIAHVASTLASSWVAEEKSIQAPTLPMEDAEGWEKGLREGLLNGTLAKKTGVQFYPLVSFIRSLLQKAKREEYSHGYADGIGNPNYSDGCEAGVQTERSRIQGLIEQRIIYISENINRTKYEEGCLDILQDLSQRIAESNK